MSLFSRLARNRKADKATVAGNSGAAEHQHLVELAAQRTELAQHDKAKAQVYGSEAAKDLKQAQVFTSQVNNGLDSTGSALLEKKAHDLEAAAKEAKKKEAAFTHAAEVNTDRVASFHEGEKYVGMEHHIKELEHKGESVRGVSGLQTQAEKVKDQQLQFRADADKLQASLPPAAASTTIPTTTIPVTTPTTTPTEHPASGGAPVTGPPASSVPVAATDAAGSSSGATQLAAAPAPTVAVAPRDAGASSSGATQLTPAAPTVPVAPSDAAAQSAAATAAAEHAAWTSEADTFRHLSKEAGGSYVGKMEHASHLSGAQKDEVLASAGRVKDDQQELSALADVAQKGGFPTNSDYTKVLNNIEGQAAKDEKPVDLGGGTPSPTPPDPARGALGGGHTGEPHHGSTPPGGHSGTFTTPPA